MTGGSGEGARGTGGSSAPAEVSHPDARDARGSSTPSGALHPLTLFSLLANYPHPITHPLTGGATFTHPFIVIPYFGVTGVTSPVPFLYFCIVRLCFGSKVTGVYHASLLETLRD